MKLCRILPLILVFALSSCSLSGFDETTLEKELSRLASAKYTVNITANLPSREVSFTLSHVHDTERDRASVILPGEIAGIGYEISAETGVIEFDDMALEVGAPPKDAVSPFSAVYHLIRSWKNGGFSEVGRTRIFGKDAVLAVSEHTLENETIEYRTWFTKENFIPLYAEIFSDGERIIQCRFEGAEHTNDEGIKTDGSYY